MIGFMSMDYILIKTKFREVIFVEVKKRDYKLSRK